MGHRWQKDGHEITHQRADNTHVNTMKAGSKTFMLFTTEISSLWKMAYIYRRWSLLWISCDNSIFYNLYIHMGKKTVLSFSCFLLSEYSWKPAGGEMKVVILTFLHLLLQFDGVWRFLLDVCSGLLVLWTTGKSRKWGSFCLCLSVCECALACWHTFGMVFIQLTGHFFPLLHFQLQRCDETFWEGPEGKERYIDSLSKTLCWNSFLKIINTVNQKSTLVKFQ